MTTAPTPVDTLAAGDVADGTSLLRNAGSLFAGQAVGMVVPLLTIPYLARVLGPAGWGPVIAAQAFGNWLILILEFGFELSGTRAIARSRTAATDMTAVVHGVQSAKTLLVLATVPVLLIAFITVPALRENPALVGWAFAFAVLRGFSPLWFYQGIERVHGAVATDTATRAAAALGVFVIVHRPADGWMVIALQAVFAGISVAILTVRLSRHVTLQLPRRSIALDTLRDGWTIFACRAWSGLYIQANALILSALASAAAVAFFGGAERIIRAAINVLQPLTQVFLPRVSFLQTSDPVAAQRLVRRTFLGVGALGMAMGLTAIVAAPLLVHIILGPGYDAAIPVLRVLGVLPVLVAVNTVLGLYWALPLGYERMFLAAIVAAGITNVVLACMLVPRWGALGMAASASGAEVVVLAWLAIPYLRRPR